MGAALLLLVGTIGSSFQPHLHGHMAKYRILRELEAAPALRLQFQVKRKSMFVHGASEFEVLAVPSSQRTRRLEQESDNDSLFGYHGVASFQDGSGKTHEYSLVDGTAYYTSENNASSKSVGCIPTAQLPPLHSAISAIHNARSASGAVNSKGENLCPPSAVALDVSFAGEKFVLCSRSSSFAPSKGFQLFGSDLNIQVEYEDDADFVWERVPPAPQVPSALLSSCGKVMETPRLSSPSLGSLFAGAARDWSHRKLKQTGFFDDVIDAAEDVLGTSDDSCSCKGTPRPCVFFSGMGSETDEGLISSFSYFGDIADHAPCCTSIQYAKLDTTSYGWDSADLQQRACDLAVQATGSATTAIENAIIVTHSMGGLTLAGAITNGKCSLADSTTWVALSPPMKGSMGSNYLQEACDGGLTDVMSEILDLFGSCPSNGAALALAYEGGYYSSNTLNQEFAAIQATYAQNVDAVMCSKSFEGLVSLYEAVFALAGAVIPHISSENDGIVEFGSCSAGLTATFGDSYTSPFYASKLNHFDTSFRNGDGLFDDAKKPLKWFECLL